MEDQTDSKLKSMMEDFRQTAIEMDLILTQLEEPESEETE